jgi:hypothetical protein
MIHLSGFVPLANCAETILLLWVEGSKKKNDWIKISNGVSGRVIG